MVARHASLRYTAPMADVTNILNAIEHGDQQASEELLPLVYQELRRLAKSQMAKERSDHTLQATALVHEAYLRLVGSDGNQRWEHRGHFFVAAAEAMRRILVDRARRRLRPKHGGDLQRLEHDEASFAVDSRPEELLSIHEMLDQLSAVDEQASKLVKLRYFGGFTIEEAAATIGVSARSAYRDWSFARAWLKRRVRADTGADDGEQS